MAQVFCDQCGFRNRAGARFCARCGNDLAEDDSGAGARARESERQRGAQPTSAPAVRRVGRPRGTVIAVLLAVLLIGLVYVAYSAVASKTYSDAVDAHKRFDCSQAADKYGQLVGFYSLALPSHRGAAEDRKSECRAVLQAESAAQEGSHRSASQLYAQILDEHATSPIRNKLRERRAEESLSWGDSLMQRASEDSKNTALALEWYEKVLAELPPTSQTEAAKRRMDRLWSSANSGDVCSRADSMMALAEGEYVSDDAQAIRRQAADKASGYLLGCGNHLIAQKRYPTAIRTLRLLIREFRGAPIASRAQASLVDAQVGQIRGGRTAELPAPAVSGRTGGEEAAVAIQNSSPYALEVLLSGPSSRRFTIPRCAECRKFSPSEVTGCPSGPSRTFAVQPGGYSVVVRDVERDVKPWAGDWRFDAGYRYDEGCFYIVTSRP